MPVLQNLYQIFKFNSSFIIEHNLDIKEYNQNMGLKEGNIISIVDNIVFEIGRAHV